VLAAVFAAGVGTYRYSEDLNWLDAAYFTMATLTTVGYGDIAPATTVRKLATLVLAPAGLIAVFGLGLSLVSEQVGNLLSGGRSRMERELATISGHYIVCGYGTLGSQVVAELLRLKQKVVVIDNDPDRLVDMAPGVLYITANALDVAVLRRAGLERARAILATFRNDADNMYLVLEARGAAPGVEVLAVASSREAVRRMYLAGAKRVISPNLVGAELLAKSAVNPGVMQLVHDVTDRARVEDELIQVPIAPGSPLAGKRLRDLPSLGLRVKVVLIRDQDRLEVAPDGNSVMPPGAVVVLAGTGPELAEAERLATPD
jgi:voltage-gated potassium channel